MKKIAPSLWFSNNAEEAVNFYVSVFKNSKINSIAYYSEAGPGKPGDVMFITFELNGTEFSAINGGEKFEHSYAVSFVAPCENQTEVDDLWEKLSKGGRTEHCGWLQDKYGMYWQVTPAVLLEMIQDKNPKKAKAVAEAMFKMVKLDIKTLQQAYDNA